MIGYRTKAEAYGVALQAALRRFGVRVAAAYAMYRIFRGCLIGLSREAVVARTSAAARREVALGGQVHMSALGVDELRAVEGWVGREGRGGG